MQENTIFTGDNLDILRGMNSETVDLIYLDPPFNSKRTYAAPVGSTAAGSKFKDIWKWQDVDEALLEGLFNKHPSLANFIQVIESVHSKAMMAYISFMSLRILELHRVLKPTGSIYLHCDPTASHYLKSVIDTIFGSNNFCNEIIWHYTHGGKSKKHFGRKHDVIFYYVKKKTQSSFYADAVKLPFTPHKHDRKQQSYGGKMGVDENDRPYVEKWGTGKKKKYRYYIDEGKTPEDVWTDINSLQAGSKERTGYPTQKPLALLHRIIKASSKEGDLVLDPFCGCATTCVAAQQLHRQWIGIDIEKNAANIVVDRLKYEHGLFQLPNHRTEAPQRTDLQKKQPDSESVKKNLYKQQNGKCNGCSEDFKAWNLEVDHIFPKSKGGGDYIENYQLLCGNCNRIKGNRPMVYLMTKIKKRNEAMAKISFGD